MASDDNSNTKPANDAALSTNALKWAAIAVLAGLAIYGVQGKTSAENELAALQGEAVSLRKAVDDAAAARKSSQDEIDRLKAAQTDSLRQIEEGKADVSTAMAKISELETKSTALGKEVEDLKAKLAAAGDNVSKLNAALDAANKSKSAAEKAAADAEAAARALRAEVDSLKVQLESARKDLEAAKASAAAPAPAPSPPTTPEANPTPAPTTPQARHSGTCARTSCRLAAGASFTGGSINREFFGSMLPLRRSSQLRFAAGRFLRPNLERGYEPRCKGAFQGADPCLPLHFQAVGRRAVPTLADVLRVCAASNRAEWRLARLLARLIALHSLRPRGNARSRSGAGYPVRPPHIPSLALRPLAMTSN